MQVTYQLLISYLILVCGVLICHISASNMDQLTEDFTKVLMECLEKNPVQEKELVMMSEKKMPENEAAKCLFACAYKKVGIIDEEGKLSEEGSRDLTKKYFGDDEKKIKISDDFIKMCLSVNKEQVSDGSKGCERAALLFKCAANNTSGLDFF